MYRTSRYASPLDPDQLLFTQGFETQANCVECTAPSKTTQRGLDRKVCGRAQWTLTFYWAPGREEVPDSNTSRPWWCSDTTVDPQPIANYIALVSSSSLLPLAVCHSLPLSSEGCSLNTWACLARNSSSPSSIQWV